MYAQTSSKSDVRVSHELCGLKSLRIKDIARDVEGFSMTGKTIKSGNRRGISI